MYKNNAVRKIDESKTIKTKKKSRHFKNRLISSIFSFCIFLFTLMFIFIFLFNRARYNEFVYKKFKNYDNNLRNSESFDTKDTKKNEYISCATEDKIIML